MQDDGLSGSLGVKAAQPAPRVDEELLLLLCLAGAAPVRDHDQRTPITVSRVNRLAATWPGVTASVENGPSGASITAIHRSGAIGKTFTPMRCMKSWCARSLRHDLGRSPTPCARSGPHINTRRLQGCSPRWPSSVVCITSTLF